MAALWTALVGLAGIAAAFFAPSWNQRRIEERREQREWQIAARLGAHDLNTLAATLNVFADQGRVEVRSFTLDTWQAHESTLAWHLPFKAWRGVAVVYERVHQFSVRWSDPAISRTLDAEFRAAFEQTAEIAREGRDYLTTLSDGAAHRTLNGRPDAALKPGDEGAEEGMP